MSLQEPSEENDKHMMSMVFSIAALQTPDYDSLSDDQLDGVAPIDLTSKRITTGTKTETTIQLHPDTPWWKKMPGKPV
jgi:hypothetical protein